MPAYIGERPEVGGEGDAGEFFGEVVLVFLPVALVVEDAVDIVEDVVFGDGIVAVVGLEFLERGVEDVVDIDTAVGGDGAF